MHRRFRPPTARLEALHPHFGQVFRGGAEEDAAAPRDNGMLLEGGALVNGAALASGEVDKIFLYYAPKIFGEGGVPFIAGETLHGEAQRVQRFELHRFGEDFALEGYLRDPYA